MYIKTEFGEFEWDDTKAAANFRKHGILFEEAVYLFKGSIYTETIERGDYGETREISIGKIGSVFIAAIIHTPRGQAKRIISARPAKRKERRRFTAYIGSSPEKA